MYIIPSVHVKTVKIDEEFMLRKLLLHGNWEMMMELGKRSPLTECVLSAVSNIEKSIIILLFFIDGRH